MTPVPAAGEPQPDPLAKLRGLITEVWNQHCDPSQPDYNGCETDVCGWCEFTTDALAALESEVSSLKQRIVEIGTAGGIAGAQIVNLLVRVNELEETGAALLEALKRTVIGHTGFNGHHQQEAAFRGVLRPTTKGET